MWNRLGAGAAALGVASILASCGTAATASVPDGTGSPALNSSVTLSVVACEPHGLCVAAGTNPSATTAAAAIEVSKGGRAAWSQVAVPKLTGTTFVAGSCWTSGCLLGGTASTGAVVLLVNPATRVSSLTSTHPPGSGISALACTGGGRCIALVAATASTAVFRTTDSGQSWQRLSTLPAALESGTSLSCATAAHCVAVGTGPGGAAAATSTDGGARWRIAARPGGLQVLTSVGCSATLRCLSAARTIHNTFELLESRDGGARWSALTTSVATPIATACASAAMCAVGGSDADGGAISTVPLRGKEHALTLVYVPDAVLAIACATPTRCAAVTQASTVSFVA